MKSKHCYALRSNLGTRAENVNIQNEVVNVVNIFSGNDSKLCSLECDVVKGVKSC